MEVTWLGRDFVFYRRDTKGELFFYPQNCAFGTPDSRTRFTPVIIGTSTASIGRYSDIQPVRCCIYIVLPSPQILSRAGLSTTVRPHPAFISNTLYLERKHNEPF
jgi:hypothetical protein